MARKNADTNSDSSSERAVALMLTLITIVPLSQSSAPSFQSLSQEIADPRQQSRSRERHDDLTSAPGRRTAARRRQSPPSPARSAGTPSSRAASADRSGTVARSP